LSNSCFLALSDPRNSTGVYKIFSVSINVIKIEPQHIRCVTLKGLHTVVDEDMEL